MIAEDKKKYEDVRGLREVENDDLIEILHKTQDLFDTSLNVVT